MHDFVSHILRQYFAATQWNEYNSYLHLTSSSAAILDFPVPTGLSLSISASPTPPFFTTYRLGALPNLRAGIGYIYASTQNSIDFGKSSKDVKLKEIIERFRIVEAPRKPSALSLRGDQGYYWLGGERFAEPLSSGLADAETHARGGGEYLIYGCLHVPSARLDALWTKRLTPTWQLIVTAVSTPPKYPINALHTAALATQSSFASSASFSKASGGLSSSVDKLHSSTRTLSSSNANLSSSTSSQQQQAAATTSNAPASYGLGPPGSTNLQITLQRDTGRWFTEYSYSVDDALWGFRVLHNFGTPADAHASDAVVAAALAEAGISRTGKVGGGGGGGGGGTTTAMNKPRIDATVEDNDAGGGLRGRFSAGAEVFISTVEKSAGLSTGIRFSTLPDTPSNPSQQAIITPFDPAVNVQGSAHQNEPQIATTAAAAAAAGGGGPSQPPTVITATLNPMMGHLSTAYAARMARDVVVCSRFDFNVYSYESEWSMGAEYWLRRSAGRSAHPLATSSELDGVRAGTNLEDNQLSAREEQQPVAASLGLSLRDPLIPHVNDLDIDASSTSISATTPKTTAAAKAGQNDGLSWSLRPERDVASTTSSLQSYATCPPEPSTSTADVASISSSKSSTLQSLLNPITGVLKARISTSSDIRLLWQGRLSNCLLSLGVKADLSPSSTSSTTTHSSTLSSSSSSSSSSHIHTSGKMGIVKSIGLEVMYFSTADDIDID
ncbi:related to Mitochondrial distribution and morphology protein 10 [Melanopsichium pennsylvanicum]|uniref:Mitochondrial distribution and morphology protein 10 n=2 Tax=Melanopsichium pennsylvanicum TaxID=63383 RepID=A0AAJ4XIS5_9BASI|nr:related to MDM10-mitochondrial morphology and inheritance component [Melanopsichium pennsylvanicum 4]SNX82797.1 related to Mitochondrial distribution and morphology protein 10 [Melanopsichium pennsylvanicum]